MQSSGIVPVESRISCKQCQQRKIKCDRKLPCFRCRQSSLECEEGVSKAGPNQGYPRRDMELRKRLKQLESMVLSIQTQGLKQAGSSQPHHEASAASLVYTDAQDTVPMANRYIASTFWDSLAGEVQGLRDALDDGHEEQDLETNDLVQSLPNPTNIPVPSQSSTAFDFVLVNPGRIHQLPGALPKLNRELQADLFRVYLDRVDVAWKIFHTPTLKAFMLSDQQYLGFQPLMPCCRALRAVLHFAGISHLSVLECETKYGQPYGHMLEDTRRVAEATLVETDLFNTRDLPAMQALAVYVATSRRHDIGHKSWSLFGLTVRLAQVISLDRESAAESIFTQQLNRRLWHHLCVLDSFFAFDRGSDPLITVGSFQRPLPANINDDQLDEATTVAPSQAAEGEVSKMNFALMLQELYHAAHRLDLAGVRTIQHRLDVTKARGEAIARKHLQHCDPKIPFQRLTIIIGEIVQSANLLCVVRPINRTPIAEELPAVGSPWVLDLALDVLRKCEILFQDQELSKWYRLPWVQWHPLAVVLSGLCYHQSASLADEAWTIVDRMMGQASAAVADTKKGRLWQPIMRLYRRALAFKISHSGSDPKQMPQHVGTIGPRFEIPTSIQYPDVQSTTSLEANWNTPNWIMSSDEWQFLDPSLTEIDMLSGNTWRDPP